MPQRRSQASKSRPFIALGLLVSTLMLVSSVFNSGASRVTASSHREAPLISADPQADNTDVYAFVSPDAPETVTLIASFYPGQDPAGGPNFYRFGDDVTYDINIDRDGDAVEDLVYRFNFSTGVQNPGTFLYNTGPIEVQEDGSLNDPDYNLRQYVSVTEIRDGEPRQYEGPLVPPANIGPSSTPNYEDISNAGIFTIDDDVQVFTGPSDDPFWVDLGGVFDLLTIRTPPGNEGGGVDDLAGLNVLTIAMQIPIEKLTIDGELPAGPDSDNAIIGVWSTTQRFTTTVINADGTREGEGDLVQVSRLGNPLINEVIVPVGAKDLFNASVPADDGQFLSGVLNPELPGLLNAIYGIEVPEGERNDLATVFLTGIPGINQPANVVASEQLRLNMAIPPADPDSANALGAIGGDAAGFPNGRRLGDEVVDISLRVVAGILYSEDGISLDSEFNVAPNNQLGDGVDGNDVPFRDSFPYVALPHSGFEHQHHSPTGAPADAVDTDTDAGTADDEDDAAATPAGGDDADADADVDAAGTPVAADTTKETGPITIALDELDGSGVSGIAILEERENGLVVNLYLDGATGGHPAHIHQGTCNELDPNPQYPLNDVGANGTSVTVFEDLALGDLLNSPYAINVHLSNDDIGTYITCGNIVLSDEATEAPDADDADADTDAAATPTGGDDADDADDADTDAADADAAATPTGDDEDAAADADADADADDDADDDADADADAGTETAAITVPLAELDGSGVSGVAVLQDRDEGLVVNLYLDGAEGGHPAHIHEGTCDDLNPNPEYPLTNVGAGGTSVTVVEGLTIADLVAAPFAINVHLSDEEAATYISCGDIVEPDSEPTSTSGDSVSSSPPVIVTLNELDDSGISGEAVLNDGPDGLSVTLALSGATGGHPAHIHEGTCDDLDPNPEYPLTTVGEDGTSGTVNIAADTSELFETPHAINIHLSSDEIGTYVACGDIAAAD